MKTRPIIAHETPLCLMADMRSYTDYDYALVHLFEDEDKEFAKKYFYFFHTSLKMGRKVLLDNSIFELGTSFDPYKFFEWVLKLQPTEYFIPDVFNDRVGTVENVKLWYKLLAKKAKEGKIINSKAIAVCHGISYDDMLQCYEELELWVDKIAIPFDSQAFDCFPDAKNWEYSMMYGRWEILSRLVKRFDSLKPLHLLGCALPQEFQHYRDARQLGYIDSIDTSNPVVHGLTGIAYDREGCLQEKCKTKLVEFMKMPLSEVTDKQRNLIFLNALNFKKFLW